jgi:hypothetical protein
MKVLELTKTYQAPSMRCIEMEQPLCTGVSGGLNDYNSGEDSDLGDDWDV